ncbi:hypothetical protein [Ideonella sp.]|uniref:hypothetical protein n=1 Tax=Ideonella sp. TaxID=1929293 RepID=UPI0035B2AEAB
MRGPSDDLRVFPSHLRALGLASDQAPSPIERLHALSIDFAAPKTVLAVPDTVKDLAGLRPPATAPAH